VTALAELTFFDRLFIMPLKAWMPEKYGQPAPTGSSYRPQSGS